MDVKELSRFLFSATVLYINSDSTLIEKHLEIDEPVAGIVKNNRRVVLLAGFFFEHCFDHIIAVQFDHRL